MDQTTSSYTSSSSSSSYEQQHPQNTIKSSKPSRHNSLHSVRKPLAKPYTKHFIAPLPPTPLKICNVEPSEFKDAVRVLTSTPEFQYPSSRRLKNKAPPPLILSTAPKPSLFPKSPPRLPPRLDDEGMNTSPLSTFIGSSDFCNMLNGTMQGSRLSSSTHGMECFEDLGPVGLGLSPKAVGYDPFGGGDMSPRWFSLSPTSLSWCSSVLLSPGTLSAMNQSPLL